MGTACSCENQTAPKLIFSCSGAADVGEVADQTARALMRQGVGTMYCLAGIGGKVSGIIKTTESAGAILAIDGCTVNCTKKCLEEAGITNFHHLQLADLGMKKGKTEATQKTIGKAAVQAAGILMETTL